MVELERGSGKALERPRRIAKHTGFQRSQGNFVPISTICHDIDETELEVGLGAKSGGVPMSGELGELRFRLCVGLGLEYTEGSPTGILATSDSSSMRSSGSPTDRLIDEVAYRLNARLAYQLIVAWIGIGSLLIVVVASLHRVYGASAPVGWYLLIGVACCGIAGVRWIAARFGTCDAARYADRRFDLRDSLATCVRLRSRARRDPFCLLQVERTDRIANQCPVHSVRIVPPWKLCAVSITFFIMALGMVFQPPSLAVQRKDAERQQTLAQMDAAQSALADVVDSVIGEKLDSAEASLISAVPLRRWVNDLRATSDQTQALRQLADLENKVRTAANQVEASSDSQVAQRAAKWMENVESSEAVRENLKLQQYDAAAESLRERMPNVNQDPAAQQEALDQMKALADAFRNAARELDPQVEQNSANAGDTTSSAPSQEPVPSDSSAIANSADELADALSTWKAELNAASQKQASQGGGSQAISRLPAAAAAAHASLGKLSRELKHLDAQKRVEEKMNSLAQAISVAQSGLAQGAIATKSAGKGGGPPGWGSRASRNPAPLTATSTSRSVQLSGMMADTGRSKIEIESATDGVGHAVAPRGGARVHPFRKQVESFVRRENVPQDVRNGVKQYFESIHQEATQASSVKHQDPESRE